MLDDTVGAMQRRSSPSLSSGEPLSIWKRRVGWTLSILLCALPLHSYASEDIHPLENWTIRHFRAADGLGHDIVRDIVRAPDGSIWFATWGGGISHYDGVHWATYRESDGLPDNSVRTLMVEEDGGIWAGMSDGIAYFDGVRWQTVVPDVPELQPPSVFCIEKMRDGQIWFGTETGHILAFTPTPEAGSSVEPSVGPATGTWSLALWPDPGDGLTTRSILELPNGEVWAGGPWGTLMIFDGRSSSTSVVEKENQFKANDLVLGHEGSVWAAGGNAVYRFDDGAWEPELSAGEGSVCVAFRPNGDILLGTPSGLRIRYNDVWVDVALDENSPFTRIEAITCLHDGAIWVGTREGAYRIASPQWQTYPRSADGVALGGAFYADPRTAPLAVDTHHRLVRFEDEQWLTVTELDDSQETCLNITPPRTGKLWVLFRDSAAQVSLRDGRILRTVDVPASEGPRGLLHTGDGTLYLLCRYDVFVLTDHGWEQRTLTPTSERREVTCIEEDPSGGLWVGVSETIERWRDGTIETVAAPPEFLNSRRILALFVSSDGSLWCGSSGSGLARYDGRNWTRFTTQDGLLSDHVSFVQESSDGTIWVGSRTAGVSSYRNGRWIRHSILDQLPAGEVRSIGEYPRGTIWVATEDAGVTAYRPTRDAPDTSIRTSDRDISAHGFGVFNFMGIDTWQLTTDEELVYSWRLVRGGGDQVTIPWTRFTTDTVTTLESLSPGQYIFEVRSADRDRNIDPTPASVRVTVLPPLWRRAGFQLPVAALLIAVVIALVVAHDKNRALRQSEFQYRHLVEDALTLILKWDVGGRITYWNEYAERVFGFSEEEVRGRDVIGTIFADAGGTPAYLEELKRMIAANPGRPTHCQSENVNKMGQRMVVSWTYRPILDDSGQLAEIHAIGVDVTEQRRTEEALRSQERRFRDFCETSSVGMFRCTPEGSFVYANQAMADICGFPDGQSMTGAKSIERWQNPDLRENILEILRREGRVSAYACEILQQDETRERSVFVSAVLGDETVDGMVVDVTDSRQLEEQLREAQRLEAVGTLAGGVAHDFNNILTGVLGNLRLAQMNLGTEHEVADYLAGAYSAGERAAALVRQLLALGRKTEADLQPVAVNEVIEEVVSLLRQTIDRRIEIRADLAPDCPMVLADPGQLNQVLMNLVLNARDGITDCLEGRASLPERVDPSFIISIRSEHMHAAVDLERGATLDARGTGRRDYVQIEVCDNGGGMSDEAKRHVFEPFFTTKEPGRGSGLGLATVYGILRQHGAHIGFDSRVGEGTVFRIQFPSTDPESSKRPTETVGNLPAHDAQGDRSSGGETVLLVDDEEIIRNLCREVLESSGYNVITADDGQGGLEAYLENESTIALVVLDQSMPHLSGTEVMDRILDRDPAARIILCSGYDTATQWAPARYDRASACLRKPFRLDEFVRVVRATLDR